MRIEHLEIFINAAQTQSFTKTAENMNMSQPAVSLAISSIEKQLGYQLFSRSRRKMILTPAGKSLYNSMKAELDGYRIALSKAKRIAMAEGQTVLRIGLLGMPAEQVIIPRILREYKTLHPTMNFEYYVEKHADLMNKLAAHELDIVLTTSEAIPKASGFSHTDLCQIEWCAVIPKSHAFAGKQSLKPSDLDGNDLIFLDSSWAPPVMSALQEKLEQECASSRIFFANNVVAQSMMVLTQQGIAVQPFAAGATAAYGLQKIPFDFDVSANASTLSLITTDDRENPDVDALLSWMKGQDLSK